MVRRDPKINNSSHKKNIINVDDEFFETCKRTFKLSETNNSDRLLFPYINKNIR